MSGRLTAATSRLLELRREPPPAGSFGDVVLEEFGSVVGYDGYCLFAVDPVSTVRTTMYSRHGLTCSALRLMENEHEDHDANRYAALVATTEYAGVLASTSRRGARSPRVHDLLGPDGYTSELRLVLVDAGRYWGALSLFRDERHHPFTDEDVDNARALQVPVARAMRHHQLTATTGADPAHPAGVALVDRDRRIHLSPEAQKWLALLEDPGDHGAVVPDLVRMLFELAALAHRGQPAAREPVARVRAASGEWLVASASCLDDGTTAVVLRPGDVRTITPAFVLWAGFTRRESQVFELLARGLTTRMVARELRLSTMTVNDHLRSMYRKAGVRGRDELLALLR